MRRPGVPGDGFADGTAATGEHGAGLSWAASSLCSTIVAQEVAAKLDTDVSFDLTSLWAHDLAGRASSYKALTAGGMDPAKAAALAGLMESEG